MKKLVLLLLPALLILGSCNFIGGKKIRGKGQISTDSRSIGSFNGVSSSGSFDIYVSSGPNSVKIEAEENLLQYIETYVDGNTLRIGTKDGYWLRPSRDIKIYVSAPSFNKIHSSGSGNIIGQGLITSAEKIDVSVSGAADIKLEVDAPEVESEITGSGSADLKGNTKKFTSRISGSGNVEAFDLKSEETEVRVSGSGDVAVFASVKLKVKVSGSGDVRYKGNPKVESQITGGGGVTKVD
ncbi:DUF2807 domain-containing protein [Pseudoflavitalea sp. G-6-1-2]|uniref:head GIN domain-containing protein n=1 Tax=Pseudoflavitalea sp. G-6-1-2 TaxID=2728841 RepID=UPI00146D0879|nr:head GIN domain-containing protein [Pseudoflavitalea sp. G-6-1-2]NML22796.1 DUF2807 domain-containing protein [Pseudoflavitalea sp. G-6-1-2]